MDKPKLTVLHPSRRRYRRPPYNAKPIDPETLPRGDHFDLIIVDEAYKLDDTAWEPSQLVMVAREFVTEFGQAFGKIDFDAIMQAMKDLNEAVNRKDIEKRKNNLIKSKRYLDQIARQNEIMAKKNRSLNPQPAAKRITYNGHTKKSRL